MSKNLDINLNYTASKTMARFHWSDAFYRGLMGPVGSGKSTACCWEIILKAQNQVANAQGVRRTRWVVVRNTYRELLDTTIQTWSDWFPPAVFGAISSQTMSQTLRYTHPDKKTTVECEVLFRALDRPDDVKKVLSLEITGAWVNEAREVPKAIIDGLGDRVGRFPAVKDGGCTWRGVIMDTNPPDEDHWWYRLAEEDRPTGWDFLRQPGGLIEQDGLFVPNPAAENLENLEPGYYLTRSHGKSPEYIRVYYCGQYGFVTQGKPVFPEYVDAVHCPGENYTPVMGLPVYVGLDFGLTPAALFAQRLSNGRWIWFDELVSYDMGITTFADLLAPKLRSELNGYELHIWGDPAGAIRSQTDEKTCYQILRAKGIPANPIGDNSFTSRREAVAVPLGRLIDGKPGLLISPKCKITRKGLAGGYCYRRVQVAGDERYHDKPDKNKFSHVVEAGMYAMLGAGEGRDQIAMPTKIKINIGEKLANTGMGWMGA